LGGQTKFKS